MSFLQEPPTATQATQDTSTSAQFGSCSQNSTNELNEKKASIDKITPQPINDKLDKIKLGS